MHIYYVLRNLENNYLSTYVPMSEVLRFRRCKPCYGLVAGWYQHFSFIPKEQISTPSPLCFYELWIKLNIDIMIRVQVVKNQYLRNEEYLFALYM